MSRKRSADDTHESATKSSRPTYDSVVNQWNEYQRLNSAYPRSNPNRLNLTKKTKPLVLTDISDIDFRLSGRKFYPTPLPTEIGSELYVFRYMLKNISKTASHTTGWQVLCPTEIGINHAMKPIFRDALFAKMQSIDAYITNTERVNALRHIYRTLPIGGSDYRRLGTLGELAVFALLHMAFPLNDPFEITTLPKFRLSEDNSPTDLMTFAVIDEPSKNVAFLEVCVKTSRATAKSPSSDNYLFSLYQHMAKNRRVKGLRFRLNYMNDDETSRCLTDNFSIYYTFDIDPSSVAYS